MPEIYTIQTKKRPGEDRTNPIDIPLELGENCQMQPSNTLATSAKQLGICQCQSLHKPKLSSDPFLVPDHQRKRYVSLIGAYALKKRMASSDKKPVVKDDARRTLFKQELVHISRISNCELADHSTNTEFAPLLYNIESAKPTMTHALDED